MARRSLSEIASQEGDSGGPVICYTGGKLMVTGIVNAADGPSIACEYNTHMRVVLIAAPTSSTTQR